jgi:hypothetical protein
MAWTAGTSTYGPVAESDACPAQEPVHLEAGTGEVQAAYVCEKAYRDVPGDGTWQFSVVRGVTGGLEELLRAYSPADEKLGQGPCTADAQAPLVVWLHGARTVAVRAPTDACGHPTMSGRSAFEALTTVEVASRKVVQSVSQASVDSKCSDTWKDMLAWEEADKAENRPGSGPRPIPVGSRACLYRVELDGADRVGHLFGVRSFTRETTDAFNAALSDSVLDPSCSRHAHTKFAVVINDSQPVSVYVALDGCAVSDDAGWWRATQDLRNLVS